MKKLRKNSITGFFVVALSVLGSGCTSDGSGSTGKQAAAKAEATSVKTPPAVPLPAGVTLKKDNDLQEIWLAPGFDFKGYDVVHVADTIFQAVERPNEKEMRAWAIGAVQAQEVEALRGSGLFKIVTANTNGLPAGGRVLELENTIIEYEKGGGGARYWAGTFGAGQPVIKVRGLMYDGNKLVFVYEARRSGDSGASRMFGGFMSDRHVQGDDVHDLALDLAGFMKRTAGVK